jgi:Na+/proline symporter
MRSAGLLLILGMYLSILFYVAHWAEKRSHSKWTNNPYIYSLSLAVYCTAWTYYGSIGVAADSGLSYLPIYLGPVLIIPVWMIILKKIIRISRVNKISSIADFISLRYGNSRFLGALVTMICIFGIVPYISISSQKHNPVLMYSVTPPLMFVLPWHYSLLITVRAMWMLLKKDAELLQLSLLNQY